MTGTALDLRDMGTPQVLSPGSSTTEGNSALKRKEETAENLNIRKGEYQWQSQPALLRQDTLPRPGEGQAQ